MTDYLSAIDQGFAPKLALGWFALKVLLTDGRQPWYSYNQCVRAIMDTGLAKRTATNLLAYAVHRGEVQGGPGRAPRRMYRWPGPR